jgi:phosphonate transport system permease protein
MSWIRKFCGLGHRQNETSKRTLGSVLAWSGFIAVLVWAWHGTQIDPLQLAGNLDNIGQMLGGFFPPDFRDWKYYFDEMVVTVQMALCATLFAVLCSIPLGLLCAQNIAPIWIYQPVRRLMDAARAINEMVFALLFIVAVGLGPFAGVLALFVHTTGILAKLFAEAVEQIDPRPVDGIRSTGAGILEEIAYAVIPQVLPLWASYALYRFESNVRSAAVVGMVGAGGIGYVLYDIIRAFEYGKTCAVLLMLIVSVTLIDLVSSKIRKTLI